MVNHNVLSSTLSIVGHTPLSLDPHPEQESKVTIITGTRWPPVYVKNPSGQNTTKAKMTTLEKIAEAARRASIRHKEIGDNAGASVLKTLADELLKGDRK